MRPPRGPCPIGLLAQASYDGPDWTFLSDEQKRDWTDFDHYDLARPDFLSFNVDDLPHKIPFLVKELTGAPILVWTVRTAEQREAAPAYRARRMGWLEPAPSSIRQRPRTLRPPRVPQLWTFATCRA